MDKSNVAIEGWVIRRKSELMYTVPDYGMQQEMLKIEPDENFYNFIAEHINNYLNHKVAPPKDIEYAIINFADEYSSNGRITIRNGDYISIQNYIKKKK